VDDATYVRRRRWSVDEKHAVVAEALSSGNVIATAKRYGIQAQQIYLPSWARRASRAATWLSMVAWPACCFDDTRA